MKEVTGTLYTILKHAMTGEREGGRKNWDGRLPRILGRLYKRLGDQLFLTILAANSTSFSHIPSLFSIPDIVPRTSCFGKIDKP